MPRFGRKSVVFEAFSRTAREAVLAGAAALLLAAALAGCGTASGTPSRSLNQVVVRVGAVMIDRAEVEHWARAIEQGNSVATVFGKLSGTPREKALEFLISSSWTIGQAQAQRLPIPISDIERGLQEKVDAAPNGRSEFQEELASTGQTLDDVKLEVESALAVKALRDAVAMHVPALTRAEVASYYARHRRSFYLPDRRLVDLIEQIPGYGHAVSLGNQLGPGARFAKRAIRELVRRESPAEAVDRMNGQLVHMIFATAPGRVSKPAMFNGRWVLAVVRKLVPAAIQPLTVVRGELSKTLAAQRRQQALKRFATAFVRRWTARTSCSPGYVVQKCSQYRGALAQGNPLVGR
jgi:hypothetical protein